MLVIYIWRLRNATAFSLCFINLVFLRFERTCGSRGAVQSLPNRLYDYIAKRGHRYFNMPANEAEIVLKLSCFTNAREHDIACEPLNVTSIMVNRRVNG